MVVVQALVALGEDLKTSVGVFADDKGAQMWSKQVVGVWGSESAQVQVKKELEQGWKLLGMW